MNNCKYKLRYKPNIENKRSYAFIHNILDESLSKNCDLGYFDIFDIADQCDKKSKADFSPEEQIFHWGLLLNSIELTSINSTDNKKTIENLVSKVIIFFFFATEHTSLQFKLNEM